MKVKNDILVFVDAAKSVDGCSSLRLLTALGIVVAWATASTLSVSMIAVPIFDFLFGKIEVNEVN